MNPTRSSKVEALADLLKRTRRGALLSQQDMANKLRISRRSVSAYESGDTEPPATIVLDWLNACDRPIDDLNNLSTRTGGSDVGSGETGWFPSMGHLAHELALIGAPDPQSVHPVFAGVR